MKKFLLSLPAVAFGFLYMASAKAQSVISVASTTEVYSDGMTGFGSSVLAILKVLIPTVLTIYAIVWGVRKSKGLSR